MSYIQFPITVNSVEVKEPYSLYKMGDLAKVRPCGDEYAGKTYLGIFLGELTDGACATYNDYYNTHKNEAIEAYNRRVYDAE